MTSLFSGPCRSLCVCHNQIPTWRPSSCSNLNNPREQLHLLLTREQKRTQKFNNCVEPSVFIIPSLLLDVDDLVVTNCVDLSWGPFGEPFHHLNSISSNSHDLMHCRMPEICCLCFLFSPSTLSHQQQQGSITGKVVDNCELLRQSRQNWNVHIQKHPFLLWTIHMLHFTSLLWHF